MLLIFVSKCLKNFFGFHGMDIKDRPCVENIYYRNIASHLLRHKHDWLSSPPDFEYKRKGLYQYLPTPLREFEEFALHDNKQGERKEDLIALKETFRKLRGFCEKCGKPAQVAFFCTGSFAWEQKPFSPCTTSDQVIISSICAQPEILCMQCCYSQVEPSLSACDLKRIGGIHALPQHGEHCLIGVEE